MYICTTLVSTEATQAHCVMCKSNRSNPYIHEPTTCTSVKPLMAHVKQQYTLVNFPLTYTTLSKKFESFHPPPFYGCVSFRDSDVQLNIELT